MTKYGAHTLCSDPHDPRHSPSCLLQVKDLSVDFPSRGESDFRALNGVGLSISEGEIVGLVGESGSGKTVLARALMGLLPSNASWQCDRFDWENTNLNKSTPRDWREWRRENLAVIWQNAQSSLVPLYTIGTQFHWLLRLHGSTDKYERVERIRSLLERVGISDPDRVVGRYPTQLSGGECQRVMIAMAVSQPFRILLADEPTSNLDVRLQADIMQLIKDLWKERQFAMLFITHDLILASQLTHRLIVLKDGEVVETGPTERVLTHPQADYTRELLSVSKSKTGENL